MINYKRFYIKNLFLTDYEYINKRSKPLPFSEENFNWYKFRKDNLGRVTYEELFIL